MEDSNQNLYFALSGKKSNEHSLDDLCSKLIPIMQNNSAIPQRCKVTPDMIRFDVKKIHDNEITQYAYETEPIFFKDEEASNTLDEGKYACCERKIIANPNIPDRNNTFFIRWAPCPYCCPAISNQYKQIFSFCRKSVFNHKYDSNKLIEFKVYRSFAIEGKYSIQIEH